MHRILALSGSLRRDSFNTRLLRAAERLAPPDLTWDFFEGLADVPVYDEDIDTDPPVPAVARLREAVAAADGLVIATPEYNHAIPGVVKNAVDWLSRPHGRGALAGKGIVVWVATLGRMNGLRCLGDTRGLLSGLGNLVVPEPEVVVASAPSALTTAPDGTVVLTDAVTVDLIRAQLRVLADVLEAQAPRALWQAVERQRPDIERARFLPYVRQALGDGAAPEVVAERLRSAGHRPETVRKWIEEARAEAGPRGRSPQAGRP
ncbi:NADPH-dependent FMN reductase [Streptomyces huiliensis]|uniref:NADPH-dependent FMN reductase n=1 Tax=Streptomyces huiliensis TaxID=2876027 RepID=UPI001CBCDF73|nr:NADPH-dependent FMN reductase [Streptomyces huiliensis]MBZ4321574.1 NAD(P)H-dependent oxidoreductase [Streptomyces huiliensis]